MGKVSGCRLQKMSSGAQESASTAGGVARIDASILSGTVDTTPQLAALESFGRLQQMFRWSDAAWAVRNAARKSGKTSWP
ncbi:uncharacterized [Tachysurus ichikawai]